MSDVGNYRVVTAENIQGKDGRNYFIEFGGYDKHIYRKTNKRTGVKLKNPVKEIALKNVLYINTQFTNENGTWRNSRLESKISEKNYNYTIDGILKAVNDISVDKYTEIQFI